MIIFMVVVIFHMHMYLCINILVKIYKCKKRGHKLLYITEYVFLHENFLHILSMHGATKFKLNEYKKSTEWEKKESFSLLTF
jgi:hypothetical protein